MRIRSVSFGSKDEDLKMFSDPEVTKDFSALVKALLRERIKAGPPLRCEFTREEIQEMIRDIMQEK